MRASGLIAFCRGRLRESEMEVTKALTGLEKDAASEVDDEPEDEKPKGKGRKGGQKGESLF